MPSAETSIKTPCNRICVVDPGSLDDAERTRIMAQLPSRLAAIGKAASAMA